MKPGDILLFHGKGVVPWLIRLAVNSHWSHAAIYAGEAWGQPFIFEAVLEGVRAFPLQVHERDERLVLRPVEDIGASVVQEGLKCLGRWYDIVSYPAVFLRALKLRWPWLPYSVRGKENSLLYCFELVAQAYRDAGYPLTHWQLVLPQYLIDAVERGRLTVVSGTLRR